MLMYVNQLKVLQYANQFKTTDKCANDMSGSEAAEHHRRGQTMWARCWPGGLNSM